MKGFPYWTKIKMQQNSPARNAELSVVRLNLSLCFLCCGFSAERNTCFKYRNTILKYLNKVANMRNEVRVDSIPMVVRIVRAQLQSKHLELETVTNFLNFLCESIKKPNHPADLHLIEFFTELVTDVNLQFFVKPKAKELFFKTLLQEMMSMCSADNLNTRLLKCIKRICSLGQEEFIKTLQHVKPKLKSLFKQNNDEAHEVAAQLLCHQEVDADSLMQIGEIILDPDFSLRTSLYLIYTLSERFSKKIGAENKNIRVAALKFLMNVAVDTFAIMDAEKVEKDEDLIFHENWTVVEEYCSYKIVPSAQWKRHSKIFQDCIDCLSMFPRREAVQCVFNYCRNILVNYSTFPVHSVIALWKLQNEFPFSRDRQYNTSYDSLLFSCVLFCSVYAHECRIPDHLTYGVTELIDSIDFLEKSHDVLNHLEAECIRVNNIDAVEYFLRIFYFFITKGYFTQEHQATVYALLSHLQDTFGENLTARTLWLAISNCYESYM
ncbi:uncharacterized protein LOC129222141 isoform X1 [Uloborus diversus]|uniref:uncharacterized protein LOC129222141 isoform X1 n=1 Tax=Uloborus diversus TaxID=327109 RepID=UPI0024095799|nr:uncharacterized protein LOC129222141 isoform X1 [Uloborus diversus]